jgi:hypothetical protein
MSVGGRFLSAILTDALHLLAVVLSTSMWWTTRRLPGRYSIAEIYRFSSKLVGITKHR